MRKEIFAIVFFALGFLASYVTLQFIETSQFFGNGGAILHVGKNTYQSEYGNPQSSYAVIDKERAMNDASVVFREAGNARAEIGLTGDNDLHIKTVTGRYGAEVFTDRLVVRASGEVDAVGDVLRQYATTGVPRLIVGDSNGSDSGSGLEAAYNHDAGFAELISISRGISYRPLKLSAESFGFFAGEREVGTDPVVSIDPEGIKTTGIVGVGTFTVDSLPQPVAGGIILVSDGASGGPVLAFSDGVDWFRNDTRKALPRPPKPIEEDENIGETGEDPDASS